MSRRLLPQLALIVLAPALLAGASAALEHALTHSHGLQAHGQPGHDHTAHGHAAHAADQDSSDGAPHGHEGDEGLSLQPAIAESVAGSGSAGCARGRPERRYDIAAIAVDITLNRYGDHDPEGMMYALSSDVDRIRAEVEQAAEGVSVGLQGDALQPLVLRVNQGECLIVSLTNQLEEPASFHLHGSSLVVAGGEAATMDNAAAMAAPGERVEYEWDVDAGEAEGTHLFHSHGDARAQSDHGLFGTLVVEPAGSTWHDPRTGAADTTGWDAVVRPGEGTAFREFVLAYHEIGHEDYRIHRADGGKVPVVDPHTSAYRPAARAINYRSEPFGNRLELQQQTVGRVDESMAYSSYAFGDPATPVLRSYVGEPVKQRVVHGGGEVAHVHHVHGGSVRWRRQPGVGPTGFGSGLTKAPSLLPGPSERTDSQSLGPSESFDVDHECSAGGCQQGAGDYLVHCHVAHHYFAGMWGIWRVYNTSQDGPSSTDALPPFDPIEGSDVRPAVESSGLSPEQQDRARRFLPPAGRPAGYDASVWDWTEEDGRLVGEPETDARWPGYVSPSPGRRPPILFDRVTGKPAYPLLRPHLGARAPFAPDHGPAPQLDPAGPDGDPPEPGANGPGSLCPDGTDLRQLSLRAIKAPVPLNERLRLTDPAGMLFVLSQEEERVRGDPTARTPLVVRANAGEDCLDVVLTSALPDSGDQPFSKVSAHIHFVQFDVQGGDGVTTGFNYEQTVRPFTVEGAALTAAVAAGDTRLRLEQPERFPVGASIGVGMGDPQGPEIVRVTAVEGADVLTVDRPLRRGHDAGGIVSTEFVRYRWYPDAQVGTSYFHDHVNGLATWQHGLIGALVVEPPGATYHDPRSGEPLSSGPVADVRLPDDRAVSADVSGSFRELVSFVQDGSKLSNVERSPGSNLSLRAEPLKGRDGPPERAFSSALHGDPETPIVESYVGDPVVLRATVGGTNEVHTLHVDGHWFRREAWSTDSLPTTTARLGISERMDLVIPAAGGPQRRAGDYLYHNGRALKLQEGAWGLLRVHDRGSSDLAVLPGREEPPAQGPICPPAAPVRRFAVAAVQARLPMLDAKRGRVFVPAEQAEAVEDGEVPAEPLVLRAAVGDCLRVTLHNRLPEGAPPASVHADGLAYDPADSGGIEAGRQPAQVVGRGQERTYTFYAHPDYGEGVAMLRDGGDLARSGAFGLYGAVVLGPPGVRYEPAVGWRADATAPDGRMWRDVALFLHDEDDAIGTHRMPYTVNVRGAVGINYANGDAAPVIEAYAGDPLRLSVLAPWSEQVQVFSVEGHRWPVEPLMEGSTQVESLSLGGLEAITVIPEGGAGGADRLPGVYQVGNHREPYREAGQSTRLVVHDACGPDVEGLERLAGEGCGDGGRTAGAVVVLLVAGMATSGSLWIRRRRKLAAAPLPSSTT